MRAYNLCDPKEFDLLNNNNVNKKRFLNPLKYYQKYYEYYYVNADGIISRLDGPALKYTNGFLMFVVQGSKIEEEDYCKHPDVLAFKYLKEHPELESFT